MKNSKVSVSCPSLQYTKCVDEETNMSVNCLHLEREEEILEGHGNVNLFQKDQNAQIG